MLAWQVWQSVAIRRHLARLRAEGVPTTFIELEARYPAVPDSENAGTLLLKAAEGFRDESGPKVELDFTKRPGRSNLVTGEVRAADHAYLATNVDTLTAIHAALVHTNSRYPVDLKAGYSALLPHLRLLKGHAHRLGVCAEMAAVNGQSKLAVQCLMDQLRLASTLRQEPTTISFLVKNLCESLTTTTAERILHHTALNNAELTEIQTAFGDEAAAQTWELAMSGELCVGLDAMNQSSGSFLRLLAMIDDAATKSGKVDVGAWLCHVTGLRKRDARVMLDYYDQSIKISKLAPTKRRMEADRLNEKLLRELASQYLPIAHIFLTSLTKIEPRATRQYAVMRCAEVACAVERWRLEHHGGLPNSLDALVPQYLTAVPEDPMDGRPLRFRPRPRGFVVYSIGANGIDDGGAEPQSGAMAHSDYTFVVEH